MNKSIFLAAGEASGDQYGAQLIESLRRISPEPLTFFGLGGEKMQAAGCEISVQARDVAVVGLVEVLSHLPRIYSRFRSLVRAIQERKPAVAILIDFPDFNLRLAKKLQEQSIPVIYFVSPQLWAWRKSRLKLVQRYVNKMLVIFPFEAEFYQQHGVIAEYVGHPLTDLQPPNVPRFAYAQQYGLDLSKPWIVLLPGSRLGEIQRHLPEMLRSASALGTQYDFILPRASTITTGQLTRAILLAQKSPLKVRLKLVDDARLALVQARAAVVASGTATVEAALAGTPFIVVYRLASLTWLLGRRLVTLPHYAMVNLIAGKRVVPELIQHDFNAEQVLKELRPLLADGEARERMRNELSAIASKLKSGSEPAADKAAVAVLQALPVEPRL
jgi:lipid-A-disaccharide synthase